jgi:hypothetical protein
MQKVERRRDMAMRVEHFAGRFAELRHQMIEIALQWLELAEQAERRAKAEEWVLDLRPPADRAPSPPTARS